MARNNRQDLYLAVNGDIRGLENSFKAGRTVLNEFGSAAVNVLEEVEKEFQRLGAGGPPPGLKEAEHAYTETFRRIGASAREAANAPTGQAAVQILDANASRAAAEAATNKAAALRIVAEAASRADQATGGNSAATRAYAVAAATAAVEADKEAAALREQAVVLGSVERQLGSLAGAQQRGRVISGQAKAGYQQLSYQLGDISMQYSLGTSASIIFAQQSGQVIQALQMIGGEGNKVLSILGGGWGIALSSALVVATPFVAKLFEGADAAGKEADRLKENAEKATIAADAKKAFEMTEAGAIDSVRAMTEEIEKQNEALRTNAERMNIRAKQNLQNLASSRNDLLEELAAARDEVRLTNSAAGVALAGEGASEAQRAAREAVTALEARLAQLDTKIAQANAAMLESRADLADEAAQRANDEVAAINYRYEGAEGLIEQAKRRAVAEGTVNAVLTKQLTTLREQQKAEVEAAQKRQQGARSSTTAAPLTTFLAPVSGPVSGRFKEQRSGHQHAGIDYAVPVGTPVRAPAAGTIDAAGAKQGYGNAIYINFGGGTTARFGHLSKFNVKPGDRVEAGDIIGYSGGEPGTAGAGRSTGAHLHYEVRRGGKAVDPRTGKFPTDAGGVGDSAARREQADARRKEAEENRRTQNADAYASLLSQAQEARYRIERSRVESADEAADLDVAAVERQRADLDRAVQKGVSLDRWTQAEADAVKLITAQNAAAEIAGIRARQVAASIVKRAELERDTLEDQATLLRLHGDLASTAADRRAIARQLLKIEQDQVEVALRAQIANERDPERKAGLQRRLAQTPSEYALRGEALERQNADPLQAYGQRLVDATSDMDEALKGIAASGFGALEDASSRAAANAVTDLLKIRGVAGEVVNGVIQDLIRLAIQKAIVSAVGTSFFGLKDGGLVPAFADGGLPGFAGGGKPSVDRGIIRGPGTGRSDSILALVGGASPILVSNGEGIVNERAVQQYWPLIDAMNKGTFPRFAEGGLPSLPSLPRYPSITAAQKALGERRAEQLEVTGNIRVSPTKEFDARMEDLSIRTVGAAAEPIMAGAQSRTIGRLRRPSLPGGWG